MLTLFTDTDTDVTPEVAKKYGYHLISMPYSIDGKTVYPYEDFDVFDEKAFYNMLRGGVLPTTSAVSEERYYEYFKPVFEAGSDILYVHFSAAMSMTFENMKRALARLSAEFPERKFYEIDTKGITTISYAIACTVGELFLAGKTLEEVLAWAETEVDHFAMYLFADDLRFFRRSGRVSGLKATMGSLLGIRPIIYMSAEGKMESIGSEKGRARAVDHLLRMMDELGDEPEKYPIFIGHTDAPDLVKLIEEGLREKYAGKDLHIEIQVANPTAGSHSGPDGVALCFHAKHR